MEAYDKSLEGLEGDFSPNPQLDPIIADQPATEEEEQRLGEGVVSLMDFLYSDDGLLAVTNVLKEDKRPIFEVIPDIAVPLLSKVKNTNPDLKGPEFFGDGGLIQTVVEELIDLAEQQGVPGAENEDELQATVINMYRKVGEFINAQGEEGSIEQARLLANDMALTKPDGTKMDKTNFELQKQGAGTEDLGAAVRQGLL